MENRTRNYIWNIVILSIMVIGFLALSVDVGLSKKEALNLIARLDAAHDFKIDMDPDDGWISHLYCNKCGFCFRYDGHNTLSFNKDFCSFDDLMKCKE